jgi:hypothetical protein
VLQQVRDRQARKGRAVSWPADVGVASEAMVALPDDAPVARPLMSRPAVVLPLFLAVVALIGWLLLRPGPDVDGALARARPLLASADPDDWERAWADHLEPLGDVTGPQADEVAAARQKAADRRELRRLLRDGSRARPTTDGERQYRAGLRLAQVGCDAAARRVWESLVRGFAGVPAEERWLALARAGLADLSTRPPAATAGDSLAAALARLNSLDAAEAAEVRAALAELYRDDPAALAVLRR